MANTNDVFVSYRRKNIEFVKKLVLALEKENKQLWIDWDDIPPGVASFNQEIERGIEGAHTFLVVLSPDYLESEYCIAEMNHAIDLNKRIVPIVYQEFDVQQLPNVVQQINWVYFIPHAGQTNDFATAMGHVIRAIEADYDHIREHTLLLQRANDWKQANRNNGFLLRGAALNNAETWLTSASAKNPEPTSLHTEFILTSRQAQARRQRSLLAGTSLLLAIAVIALVIAVQQFFVATRRADENLSLLIANDAVNANNLGDSLTAISRAYFANTMLDNPPNPVQSALQQVALQPAPRFIVDIPIPNSYTLPLPLAIGDQVNINDEVYLVQDSATDLSIYNASDDTRIQFELFDLESRDDNLIHPDVMANINNILVNVFSVFGVGYDLSPDGTQVAIGSEGSGGLVIWRNEASAPIIETKFDHDLLIDNVQFSADGRILVSKASEQQNVNFGRSDVEYFIWDTSTWQVIQRVTQFDNTYELNAISEDGRYLIFAQYDNPRIVIWDTQDGAAVWQLDIFDFVQDLAFTSESQDLIMSSVFTRRMAPPNNLTVINPDTGQIINDYVGLNLNNIVGLPILLSNSADTVRLIADDGTIGTLNLLTGDISSLGNLDIFWINGLSENGRFVAEENFEPSELVIYDLETLSESGRIPLDGSARSVSISDDGQYVAYTVENADATFAQLHIYDFEADEIIQTITNVTASFVVRAHLFGEDGIFVYQDRDNLFHMLDVTTGESIQQLTSFLEPVNDMAYTASANKLAVAGQNGSIMVWDTNTGAVTFQTDNVGNLAVIAITDDGSALATADESGHIQYWRLFDIDEALAWVEANRTILPLSATDRNRYGLD